MTTPLATIRDRIVAVSRAIEDSDRFGTFSRAVGGCMFQVRRDTWQTYITCDGFDVAIMDAMTANHSSHNLTAAEQKLGLKN